MSVRLSIPARAVLAIVGCLLLLPVVTIPLQDRRSLEQFHNRSLSAWPRVADFIPDPVKYLTQARLWLGDRVYPIIPVSHFYKELLFYVLATPPEHRVIIGTDGYIFLNGTDDDHLNNILESVCVDTANRKIADAFARSLGSLASYSAEQALPIDVIIVPTLETLYGDRLPSSVPGKYRSACAERAQGKSLLAGIHAPPPVHYVFPFSPMHAARNDPAFFPKGNWHPDGLSLKIVRDAYLRNLGLVLPHSETLIRTEAPSELLMTYGINWPLPVYRLADADVVNDEATNAALQVALGDLFPSGWHNTRAFRNRRPDRKETVLLLSDSFGDRAGPVLASGFHRLVQVDTNDMKPHSLVGLLACVFRVLDINRIVILMEEGDTARVVGFSRELQESLAAKSSSSTSPVTK
jgi:hypothetical protein